MTQIWAPMILSSNGGEWLPIELDDASEVIPLFEEGQDYPIGTVRMRMFDETPDCTCDWETIAKRYSGEVIREVRTHLDEDCPEHG